jgi:Cd2+/Zn2+-exporting ATPase
LNEEAVTDESVPASKEVDAKAFNGTIVDNGYVKKEAERVGDGHFLSLIRFVKMLTGR